MLDYKRTCHQVPKEKSNPNFKILAHFCNQKKNTHGLYNEFAPICPWFLTLPIVLLCYMLSAHKVCNKIIFVMTTNYQASQITKDKGR